MNILAKVKVYFIKYHVKKVFAKPRRLFMVLSIHSKKFKHFSRDNFNALPFKFKNNLRNYLRDLGLNIRVSSSVKISDKLMKAKEYAHT